MAVYNRIGGGASRILIDGILQRGEHSFEKKEIINKKSANPFPISTDLLKPWRYLRDDEKEIDYFFYLNKLYFGSLEKGFTEKNIPNIEALNETEFLMTYLKDEVYFLEEDYFYKCNIKTNLITQLGKNGSKPYSGGTKCILYPLNDNLYLIQHEPWGYGGFYYYQYNTKNDTWTELNSPEYPYPTDERLYFLINNLCYLLYTNKNNYQFNFFKTSNGTAYTKVEKKENNININCLFKYKNNVYAIDNNALYKFNTDTEIFEKYKELGDFKIQNSPDFFYIENNRLYIKDANNNIMTNELYYKKIK